MSAKETARNAIIFAKNDYASAFEDGRNAEIESQALDKAIDAYAAAAVAEARAPLVEILRAVEWPEIHHRTAIIGRLCPSCGNWKGDDPDHNYHEADCPLAAALAAKETP